MMTRLSGLMFLCVALLAPMAPAGVAEAEDAEYTLSIPKLKIPEGHRIIALTIDLVAGSFAGFSNIPPGWNFSIDNDVSGRTKVDGTVLMGSAALFPDDLAKIRLRVTKNEVMDLKFAVSGEVSTTKDFEDDQPKMNLQPDDFSIEAVK